MIGFVRGILFAAEEEFTIIETASGLGLQITVTEKTYRDLPALGLPVFLHTYLQVTENEMKLFGFSDKEELELFLKITGISGLGARAALNVLGRFSPAQFYQAVLHKDEKLLTTVPGIGKKMAQRLLFELKDKIELKGFAAATGMAGAESSGNYGELLEAMEALGYQRGEIMPLLTELHAQGALNSSTEESIKLILRRQSLAKR